MQQNIRQEIMVNAPIEKVYQAISDPEQITHWFPDTVEGRFAVGEQPILGFGEHGKCQIYVVDVKAPEYFAFRWVPGSECYVGDVLSVPTTLVEFRLERVSEETCKVTLLESGFSDLPSDMIDDALKQNTNGWNFMLERLGKYFG
ncbi:SRPBCC family protein [Alteromonas ponticola]|uniref:SRPBCC family protein n=1 Tax=Alteromonas aquimaris TaxID=2998417 RepID=A0ABT3P6J4_9ALTE|nr:SRPBCC family protein [Alteromonas aquimaris]MCW8108150.1 SRPBCC family protein [Alteromonas aquimaris]